MVDLSEMETPVLLDMLAEYTLLHTRLFKNYSMLNSSPEYHACKNTLQQIISELDRRNAIKNNRKVESSNDDKLAATA